MVALSLFGAGAAAAAAAQPAANAAAPAQQLAGANLAVNEAHGDWSVRCFQIQSIAPCDILQLANNQDTNQRVLLVSIAFIPSRNSYFMQVIVPLGVALARGITLAAGENTLTGVKYSRCERDGCYVEVALPEPTVASLSSMTENTTITIIPYGQGDPITLPLSVNGFSEAIGRMQAQARQRATNPPPNP